MLKTRLVELMAATGLALALGLPATGLAAPPSSLKGPLLVQNQINQQAEQSQDRVAKLASQRSKALQKYLSIKQQTAQLKAYNEQISQLIESQKQRMAEMRRQMERLGTEAKQVVPLMLNMIDGLRKFIKRDLPFHRDERLAHVEKLEDIMNDADVTIAEKFRQIMKSYMEEVEYGNTIAAYRDTLKTNGKSRTVQFIRIGRVALMYQTLDGSETGYWNRLTEQWTVDNSLREEFQSALSVANESGAPTLIVAPVPAPINAEAE